jgi:hypothetical protein
VKGCLLARNDDNLPAICEPIDQKIMFHIIGIPGIGARRMLDKMHPSFYY